MSHALIKSLNEQRINAVNQIREMSDRAAAENRSFSGEEESAWTAHHAELETLDARITQLINSEARSAEIDALMEKVGDQTHDAPAEVTPTDEQTLRRMVRGEIRSADFAPESRDLSKLTAGAGANTVPTGFYPMLFESLVEASSIMRLSANIMNTSSGENIQLPLTNAFPTAALIAEAGTITESDPSFAQTTIAAYKYAFITQVSQELLDDNAVNLVEFLGRRGGEALGNGIGAAFITGTGTSQPTGVAGTAGFTTVASASGSAANGFSYDDVLKLQHSITRPYRQNASFICNDSVTLTLRKLRDGSGGAGTGQYLWQPSVIAGQPDTLAGSPIYTDPAMPTVQTTTGKGLAFGDWSRGLAIRIAGGVRVESSTDFAFANDLVSWRFITRADSRIVDTNAARVLTYLT